MISQPSSSFAFEAVKLRNRQVPNVIEDKAIPRIVSREPIGGIEIERVQSTLEAGSVVHSLAERVGSLELQSVVKFFCTRTCSEL